MSVLCVCGELADECRCRTVVVEQRAKIERLRAEIQEWCVEALEGIGMRSDDGWVCTNALSGAYAAGERLVELGTWERKPTGPGRIQWYRPIKAADEAEGGG